MRSIAIGGYEVHFINKVLSIFAKFKQKEPKQKEAGGILFGQVKDKKIYITRVTLPNAFDSSSRTSFKRDRKVLQVLIDYEFQNSEGKNNYLGEWHTHPEKCPSPSATDLTMINDQLKKNELNYPFVLQYIQGTSGYYLRMVTKDDAYEVRELEKI